MMHASICLAIVAGFLSNTAIAAPKSGIGLNAGYVSTTRDCGGCAGNTSSGLSVGIDYQIPVAENISINPFLQSSAETTSVSGINVGHGILGGQLRYWVDDKFFGGQIANYSEYVTNGSVGVSGNGIGYGLVAGWEKPGGGLYFMGQLDSATAKYSGLPNIGLNSLRFSIGYRF